MVIEDEVQGMLSVTECVQIVRNSLRLPNNQAVKLRNYKIERGSTELVGFMGEYYKLIIWIDEGKDGMGEAKQLDYFVKSVPISNAYHRDECERKGFFGKETAIYKHILPNIQKYAPSKLFPECFYTRHDLIVLEDLSTPAQGFRHAVEPYTQEHHELMLRHLAKLHAASVAWELDEGLNIGAKFRDVLFELQLTTKNEWYVTGAKSVLYLAKMHPKFQDSRAQRFVNERLYEVLSSVETLTEPSTRFRNVLCHRDSWDRNIFYKYDAAGRPIDVRIVDFQLTRYSSPSIDVLFFLYLATTREQRHLHLAKYLDFYFDALQAELGALKLNLVLSRQQFLADCHQVKLAVLIMCAICEPLMRMPEGLADKMRREEPERFDHYMNNAREELFERVMAADGHYRASILAPIEELMEYLLEAEQV